MPCSCDGYGPTPQQELATEREKVEHLEKSLCNAQSLIHKLVRHIDHLEHLLLSESVTHEPLSVDLQARAREHIALLVKHKRAEHEHDREKADEKLRRLHAEVKSEHAQREYEDAQRAALEKARAQRDRERLAEVERLKKLIMTSNPTDEELLG